MRGAWPACDRMGKGWMAGEKASPVLEFLMEVTCNRGGFAASTNGDCGLKRISARQAWHPARLAASNKDAI